MGINQVLKLTAYICSRLGMDVGINVAQNFDHDNVTLIRGPLLRQYYSFRVYPRCRPKCIGIPSLSSQLLRASTKKACHPELVERAGQPAISERGNLLSPSPGGRRLPFLAPKFHLGA